MPDFTGCAKPHTIQMQDKCINSVRHDAYPAVWQCMIEWCSKVQTFNKKSQLAIKL